jgi:3-deoxy-D-manno-octulosonate 8-phosphate phosphatase (KDO 8-P phosphatase)
MPIKPGILYKTIDLIVYDFDGVLTDNRVIVNEDGVDSVTVNRADGLAISILKAKGIRQIILSTETNKVVKARAKKLKIPVIQGLKDKKQALLAYCKKNKISANNTIYIGNDINDISTMSVVGYPASPSDAAIAVRRISKIKLDACGGAGVVRELLDYLKI